MGSRRSRRRLLWSLVVVLLVIGLLLFAGWSMQGNREAAYERFSTPGEPALRYAPRAGSAILLSPSGSAFALSG